MYIVKRTAEFDLWLQSLKDNVTRIRLARRLDKVQRGNLGDVKVVGSGVLEMRELLALAGGCISFSAEKC